MNIIRVTRGGAGGPQKQKHGNTPLPPHKKEKGEKKGKNRNGPNYVSSVPNTLPPCKIRHRRRGRGSGSGSSSVAVASIPVMCTMSPIIAPVIPTIPPISIIPCIWLLIILLRRLAPTLLVIPDQSSLPTPMPTPRTRHHRRRRWGDLFDFPPATAGFDDTDQDTEDDETADADGDAYY